MNVDARLQLTMSQRLVMTPMLQQAIKLLQMSRLELVDLVKQELLENPILDEVEDIEQYQHQQNASSLDSSMHEGNGHEHEGLPVSSLEVIGLEKQAKQEESSVNWEEYFADNPSSLGYYGERDFGEQTQPYETMLRHSQSLTDHLTWQLHMSRLPERMLHIATFLIGQIDESGYIHCEAQHAADTYDPATLILLPEKTEEHRQHVLDVLQEKLNTEFERHYLRSIAAHQQESELLELLLRQEYYDDLVQHHYEQLCEKLQALTFEQVETIGKLICGISSDELETFTGIPAAEITAALNTVQRICRDLRDIIEQSFTTLVNESYDVRLEKLELSVEELYLVEYVLLHVSAEEIAYVASKEHAEKATRLEQEVREFLQKLQQSYAHVDQLQSHKYFLIQLYRIGTGVLIEHLKTACPSQYQSLLVKLSAISTEMIARAETKMHALLETFRQETVPVSPKEVEHALRHIQTFTPAGVGARDLQECLLIQAQNLGISDTILELLIRDHLRDIQQHRYAKIASTLNIPVKEVELMASIVADMSPRPGGDFSGEQPEYIVPDIYVYKVGDTYEVVLNDDDLPYLRINPLYKKLVLESEQGVSEDARQYVEQKLRSAMWFIRSVEQRKRTIYKVGKSLVKFQRDFLEHGMAHLKPLVLRDVADDISMHESTVSRVTTNKYIHTPQGVFELKFFFHSGLESTSGVDISSIAVKEQIKQLIAEEDPARPLSDKALEKILNQNGIEIARRTIAKYREELHIPSSLQRKHA